MLRFIAPAVTVVFVLGCSAPAPSLKMFAPGATRIPPPGTGSYSTNGSYYEGPHITSPPVGTGTQSTRPRRIQSSQTNTPTPARLASNEKRPLDSASSQLQATGFESRESASSATGARSSEPPIRIVDNGASSSRGNSLAQSSPARPATALVEPKPFRPPHRLIEISQLPTPTRPVKSSLESRRVITSATSQPAPDKSRAAKSRADGGWQARERTSHSVQIAGR